MLYKERVKDIAKFDAEYDRSHESAALQARGVFIRKFPLQSLQTLTLEDYVAGHGGPSFCNMVESGTRRWAIIQGATSLKFGVYFGKTKKDPVQKYRFSEKFGTTKEIAFRAVKVALLDLATLGAAKQPDFAAIDANPLSQMFKAKILSLYYPNRFVSVCSGEHLELAGRALGLRGGLPASEYQNHLMGAKQKNQATSQWSTPKFMAYLYRTYIRPDSPTMTPIAPPRSKKYRLVDFDEIQKERGEIGRLAEEFALKWEKNRLVGAQLGHLIARIEDRRKRPAYGHDFLSFTSEEEHRYIEVKCVAHVEGGYRFFLSDNERQTSIDPGKRDAYYFYLVFLKGKRVPDKVMAVLADQIYSTAEMLPSCFEVRFDWNDVKAPEA
jgi:hypothetical protein